MKTIKDIRYKETERGLLDFYVPETTGEGMPVVVWFHGGGIAAGCKEWSRGLAEGLDARGVAVAAANYSLYPNTKYPEYLEDAKAAVEYVIAHAAEYVPGFDGRVFVGGTSAGAYISMMLCFAPEYFGSTPKADTGITGYIFDAGQTTTHFNVLRERGLDTRMVRVDEASPMYHITPEFCEREDAPHILFIWADNDIRCRAEQNELMVASMFNMGYPQTKVTTKYMRDYGHTKYDDVPEGHGTILSESIAAFIGGIVD